MIVISLGKGRDIDPDDDPLGRARVGYDPGITEHQALERGRGVWVLGQRAADEEWLTVAHHGEGLAVARIRRVVPAGDRAYLEVDPITVGPIHDAIVGAAVPTTRNPVSYRHAAFEDRACACGCGSTTVDGATWLIGHDTKAIHERIALVGGVQQFCTWFDSNWKR